jgi:hypothetical protein
MELIKGGPADRAGATVPVKSIKACVVYDAASGRIHHHHSVLTLEGGREPDVQEIAADALGAAGRRRGAPGGSLEVLHIAHDAMDPGKRYRVDVVAKKLVVLPSP